jgi:hypothetical protein
MRLFQCRKSPADETSQALWSFATPMKLERKIVTARDRDMMDRQIIRVDLPNAHAGITAALRRAFEAAAAEPCDRDFGELLRQLN